MIIDLPRFIAAEHPDLDQELKKFLEHLEAGAYTPLPIEEVQQFHLLYRKICPPISAASPRSRRTRN